MFCNCGHKHQTCFKTLLLQGVGIGFIKCAHEVYAQEMPNLQMKLLWWL
jgi:hypothetical protein